MESNPPSSRPIPGTPFAIALLATAIAIFFASQISASSSQGKLLSWQMDNGAKQIENAKKGEANLRNLIEQQKSVVEQANKVQKTYQEIFEDLLEVADTDADAKAIVTNWKIQRGDKPKAADKPTEKPR